MPRQKKPSLLCPTDLGLDATRTVSSAVLLSQVNDFIKDVATKGWAVAVAGLNPATIGPVLTISLVLGVAKQIKDKKEKQKVLAMADKLCQLCDDQHTALEILRDLKYGEIELNVHLDRFEQQELVDLIDADMAVQFEDLENRLFPFLQRFLDAISQAQNIQHARSNLHRAPQEQNFVGRQALLDKVHALLASGSSAALSHSVAGEGGVGKTQIAVQYAIRHAGDYAGRWWVNASKDTAEKSLRELAKVIGCTITDQHGPPEIRSDISKALAADGPHLVILDNVDDRATLNGSANLLGLTFFPETCRVLVTTRLDHLLPTDRTINVPVLEPAEAVALLRSRREDPADTRHDEVLLAIAEELGRHTLAVKLAAALLADPLQTPTALLDELRRVEIGSLDHPFHGIDESELGQYAMDVAKSLALMLPRLEGELWSHVLIICSLCAPEDIPVELIRECLKTPDGEIDAVLKQLDRFSIIDITAGGEAGGGEGGDGGDGGATITIHRLMQSLMRHLMPDDVRAAASGALVGHLLGHFGDLTNYQRWAEHDRFLPHADAVLARFGDSTPEAAALTQCTASGHRNRLRFGQAIERYERAEAMCRAALGDNHPELAVILSNHATLLHILGRDLDRAIAMLREAERIDQAAFGDDHPKVATVVNNIGSVLKDKGDLDGALACFREAERIDRAALGDGHPNVVIRVNNIGSVLQDKGDLDGALACYREAERIDRAAFGDNHPNVARDVNNIGSVLKAKGNLDGALACFREAERIDRAAFGDDHPMVATRVNNIGSVLQAKGDLDGALACYREVERIFRKALGDDHPNVATVVNNIGMVLQAKGDLDGALACLREAERIDRAAFGDDHPKVATRVNNIGGVLQAKGDLDGAREMQVKAFSICIRTLGPRAMNTLTFTRNIRHLGVDPIALARQLTDDETAEELGKALGTGQ